MFLHMYLFYMQDETLFDYIQHRLRLVPRNMQHFPDIYTRRLNSKSLFRIKLDVDFKWVSSNKCRFAFYRTSY